MAENCSSVAVVYKVQMFLDWLFTVCICFVFLTYKSSYNGLDREGP